MKTQHLDAGRQLPAGGLGSRSLLNPSGTATGVVRDRDAFRPQPVPLPSWRTATLAVMRPLAVQLSIVGVWRQRQVECSDSARISWATRVGSNVFHFETSNGKVTSNPAHRDAFRSIQRIPNPGQHSSYMLMVCIRIFPKRSVRCRVHVDLQSLQRQYTTEQHFPTQVLSASVLRYY
jgi:hypothetical protein